MFARGSDGGPSAAEFSFDEAFDRNIGWVTTREQQVLRGKKAAIAGMGGVGGVHLLTLARLGIGNFHISDFDAFELANFNRQIGATVDTVGRPKAEVLEEMAYAVNPELDITVFPDGIDEDNIDAFLDGVDVFIDGFDFFVLDVRAKVFKRCAERGIPAITAAPIGMGTAYLVFMPGGMTFEEYFRLEGLPLQQQYVNFFMGLVPKGLQSAYLVDPGRLDLASQKGPSSMIGCQLCAGVAGAEAVKVLLGREPVRAAPAYHQFDAHTGKYFVGRLRGGNNNPLQRFKLKKAYAHFASLSPEREPSPTEGLDSEIKQIIDVARWAPSGDNTQPWRFDIEDEDSLTVHVRDQSDDDVYDYKGGQPSLLSTGAMLETMRIAASEFGRTLVWQYRGAEGHHHRIKVQLLKTPGTKPDPLLPFTMERSVDREPYQTKPLTVREKAALVRAAGDDLEVRWHIELDERWEMAKLSGLATDIRLRIPEAFRIHQRILDWTRKFSPDGIPAGAIGLDALTLKIMRWALQDWKRVARMNLMPAATLMARVQMDYMPGLFSAAYFTLTRKETPKPGTDTAESVLRTGMSLQRFWLTATSLGLAMQPAMATVIFADYGRHDIEFTASPKIRRRARQLAQRLDEIEPDGGDNLLFMGRIGKPRLKRVGPRSVRLPVDRLISKDVSDAAPAQREEDTSAEPAEVREAV